MFDNLYNTIFHWYACIFPKAAQKSVDRMWFKIDAEDSNNKEQADYDKAVYINERNKKYLKTMELLRNCQ